jgi:hypothetical protein
MFNFTFCPLNFLVILVCHVYRPPLCVLFNLLLRRCETHKMNNCDEKKNGKLEKMDF